MRPTSLSGLHANVVAKDIDQEDDLKAFERRMVEIMSTVQPSMWRWRMLLTVLGLATLLTSLNLIVSFWSQSSSSTSDAATASASDDLPSSSTYLVRLISSLCHKEIAFVVSVGLLLLAFVFGIHRKVVASTELLTRVRSVLADYGMSCDAKGRLILKPRPPAYFPRMS